MEIHFDSHNIRDLEADFDRVPNTATKKVGRVVESTAKQGNDLAKNFARESAGDHGKWYHLAFSAESAGGAFGLSWKYGPDANMRQGGMSFNGGSRNQPPHLDLEKSMDIIGPPFQRRIGDAVGESLDGN